MDAGVQRKIDQAVGPLICRMLSLFSGGRAPSEPPKRILIILLSEMGSLVLGCSMFRRIREKYPQASIHAMVFEKNREILDSLEVIPPENVMTLGDASLGGLVSDSLAAIRQMRELRFDVVIDCELFARVSSIFSYFSGAPLRVGFRGIQWKGSTGAISSTGPSCTTPTDTSATSFWPSWMPSSRPPCRKTS